MTRRSRDCAAPDDRHVGPSTVEELRAPQGDDDGIEHAEPIWCSSIDVYLESTRWRTSFIASCSRPARAVYGIQARRQGGPFERVSGAIFYKGFNALPIIRSPRTP